MELNLKPRSSRHNDRQSMALRALELGYSTIVWNVAAFGKLSQYKPIPEVLLSSQQLDSIRNRRGLVVPQEPPLTANTLRQLSRLTVSVEDVTEAQQLTTNNDTLRQFDIIAATPSNMKVFAHLCRQSDIDIIALDFTHRQNFSINKKLLDCAVERGISFEIIYSPLFQAPATRRQVMSNTKLLLQYLNGRNTIISSGAEVVSHMRSPQDAVQLGLFLGVPTVKAEKTVREHCSMVIQHAVARKQRYLPLEIISNKEFEKRWPEMVLRTIQSADLVNCTLNESSAGHLSDCDEESDKDEEAELNNDMLNTSEGLEAESSIVSQSDDINELDGYISLGGNVDTLSEDMDREPAYNSGESSSQSRSQSQKELSFMDKVQQSKKRKQDKRSSSSEKKVKKSKS